MRRRRPLTALFSALLLFQSLLVGKSGYCDAPGRYADEHRRHAAIDADQHASHSLASHEAAPKGANGGETKDAPTKNQSDAKMPAGACGIMTCAPTAALVTAAPSIGAMLGSTQPSWSATLALRSTTVAPETPPPRA